VGLHLASGVLIAALVLPFVGPRGRSAQVQSWSRQLLAILVVRLRVAGERPQPAGVPLMMVANHVSWLDIYALNAVLPARFVAKSEVRAYPLIGWLSERVGTLFIRRAQPRDVGRIIGELAEILRGGDAVVVFPEGTTSDGSMVMKFHSSLLQAAVNANAGLQPVAIRYCHEDGTRCEEAAFIGGTTLLESLKLIAAQPAIYAELTFLPPVAVAGRERAELAHAARELILRSLSL
jgi:1-acyl-sn-glycerol-3-phosphate acyltransferase